MLKDDKFLKEMGTYFKRMRKQSGLSQLEVSKRLGYGSAQFISNWERGLAAPPLEKLGALVKMYGVNPEEVFQFIMSYQEKLLRRELFNDSPTMKDPAEAKPLQ